MASFSIPLTGLDADSTALNTIANDLSNMNTTAFKAQTTNFSDLFYQEIGSTGSGDPIQVGAGTRVANTETDFTVGTPDSTGLSSNVALTGNGFFVVNDGNSHYLTRDGDFQTDASGNLITSSGDNVMGYSATNGVVNTSVPLTGINIPMDSVQAPQATSSFGLTANLNADSPVGTSFPAAITVYDSQGVAYPAQVTFTKTGTNTWSYDMSVPNTLAASNSTTSTPVTMAVTVGTPATANVTAALTASSAATPMNAITLTPASTVNGGNTTFAYNFGANGTVDSNTSLTIAGNTVTTPAGGESVAALQGQINGLGITGVSASVTGNTLSITAQTGAITASSIVGDLAGITNSYTFNTGGTVDPASSLTISGTTTSGAAATITAPSLTSGESITQYAADLNTAIGNAGIANVSVSANGNTLSIVGPDLSTAGSLSEDMAGTSTTYNFGSTATVDPGTSLSITGQTATGASATITQPQVTAGETVAQYQQALNNAIGAAGIVGVSVTSTGGQLTITGANLSTSGSITQYENATTTGYTFGSSGGTLATVDPSTNLTISGLTSSGATATMLAPSITAGETVASYATALQQAVNTAGIAGVTVANNNGVLTVTGANQTTAGSVIQDAVASANASGSLTFNASGDLVSPAANVTNMTFGGFSDDAASLDLTWNILGSSGTPTIGQVDATSALTGSTQNGYTSGTYQGFSIGSDGTVSVSYSNGNDNVVVGQLAMANVANDQGLQALGNGDYAATSASGTAAIGTSGSAGLGAMEDDALEASNVNISQEFSDLIVAQRAFEANAKSVTTFDQVEQDTINMVH
jgi:flagellar hook protein FlgE